MIRWRNAALTASLLALGLSACATTSTPPKSATAAKPAEKVEAKPLPKGLDGQASTGFPSTYKPFPSRPTAFVGATVLTATGQQIEKGVVIASGGGAVASAGAAAVARDPTAASASAVSSARPAVAPAARPTPLRQRVAAAVQTRPLPPSCRHRCCRPHASSSSLQVDAGPTKTTPN